MAVMHGGSCMIDTISTLEISSDDRRENFFSFAEGLSSSNVSEEGATTVNQNTIFHTLVTSPPEQHQTR